MVRTFERVKLDIEYPERTVYGQCGSCGRGATVEDVKDHPNLEPIEIAGLIADPYGNAGEVNGEVMSFLCRPCYDESGKRSYVIWMHDGEDVLTECVTLDAAMKEVASFLAYPDDYARYAPFRITATNTDWSLEEHIATIDVPSGDKARSRAKQGY